MFTVKHECGKTGATVMIEAVCVETFKTEEGIEVVASVPDGSIARYKTVEQPDPHKVDHNICDKVWVMNRDGQTVAKYIL